MHPFIQNSIGAIDEEGHLVIEDNNEPSLWSIGTGDIWSILKDKESEYAPNL